MTDRLPDEHYTLTRGNERNVIIRYGEWWEVIPQHQNEVFGWVDSSSWRQCFPESPLKNLDALGFKSAELLLS